MKNIFESTYKELDENGELYECDGGAGCAGGGISGGDMTTGTPLADGSGIASDAVLGPSGEFEKGKGFMGKGDFHVAFPVCPMLFRYGKDCCNGGGSNKKRKKGKKTVSVKNPYTKGMKTIIAEGEDGVFQYAGQAKQEFDKVVSPTQQIYTGVLNYNDALKLAWMIKDDGILHMYKPMNLGDFWTVYATQLTGDGMIQMDYKAGKYPDENTALNAVYKAAQQHKKALEEHLNNNQIKLTESEAKAAFIDLCSRIDESSETGLALAELKKEMKNPADLNAFMKKHQHEIEQFEKSKKIEPSKRGIFKRMCDAVKGAAKRGFTFIKKHWWKILLVLAIILLVTKFGLTSYGLNLGTKLFGGGKLGTVGNASTQSSGLDNAIKSVLAAGKPGKGEWTQFSINDTKGISTPYGPEENGIWCHNLRDGRDAYEFPGDDKHMYVYTGK